MYPRKYVRTGFQATAQTWGLTFPVGVRSLLQSSCMIAHIPRLHLPLRHAPKSDSNYSGMEGTLKFLVGTVIQGSTQAVFRLVGCRPLVRGRHTVRCRPRSRRTSRREHPIPSAQSAHRRVCVRFCCHCDPPYNLCLRAVLS